MIALIGAMILTRPGAGAVELGALLALGAALVLGAEVILIKRLAGRESPSQILLINNVIGVCIATFAASFVWVWPTGPQWAALAGIGFLMAAAQAWADADPYARADLFEAVRIAPWNRVMNT